jgi:Domain of unknown function (DUF4265)
MAVENTKDGLVKIIFDVADDTFGVGGERVWAKPLGEDLYEIQNTPWHTCDINWGDVVKAIPEATNQWPKLLEVVRRSGHRTLHLYFLKATDDEKDAVLKSLKEWKASYENYDNKLYALDVEPNGDFDGLCDYLDQWEKDDKLSYRTTV